MTQFPNLGSAILMGMTERADITGLRAGSKADVLLADIIAAIVNPAVVGVIIEELEAARKVAS